MGNQELLQALAGAIATGGIRVVDLSQSLRPSTPVIQLPPPLAPSQPFRIDEISHYDERGPAWYWNNISCGEHTGRISTRRRTGSRAASCRTLIPTQSRRSS